MKSKTLLLATSFFLTSTLVACTQREVPITQHEGPMRSDEVVTAPSKQEINIDALKALDVKALNQKLVRPDTAERVKTLTSLSPFILDRAYVENERLTSSRQMREVLMVFMRALVGDATTKGLTDLDSKTASNWIEQTRVVIESGCDGAGKGCSSDIIRFFRQDVGSAKVMEHSAKEVEVEIDRVSKLLAETPTGSGKTELQKLQNDLVRTYYRRLKMSYELKNFTMDRELEFLYLSRASQYAEAFNSELPTTRERLLLAQHVEVFETILSGFNPDFSNTKFRDRFERFVNNFGPWRYSRRVENPFGNASTRMLTLAAQNFLYSDGKLSTSLKTAIRESQEIAKSTSGMSQEVFEKSQFDSLDIPFSLVVKHIKEKQPAIWQNLGLNDSFDRNEYFFIVDRIFGDHLNIEDASEVWRGTKRDSEAILKIAEHYVKIQIAAQTVRTNKYMASIYSNREWSSTTLLEKAIEQSYPVQTQWGELLGRIERIHLFLDRSLKSTEDVWGSSTYNRVDKMFSSIRRNIKYLSVYPNMMMMAYYMAETKFKIPIYTFFGKFDIDTGRIIGWFFNGNLTPFFNFGNDGVGLKRIETLYAFLFALKTDTFASFSASRGERIDVVKFFEAVITKFLDEERIEIVDAIDDLRLETRRNSMETFLTTCEQDRQLINRGMKPGTSGAKLPIDLWSFRFSTYVGTNASSSFGQAALAFHSERRAEKIRKMNSALRAKLEFVQIMTALLQEHMTKSGNSKEEIDKIRQQVSVHTERIRLLRTQYLTEITRWNNTLAKCIDQAVDIEIGRQGELLEMEEKHLRHVWAKMKEARSSPNKDAIFAEINKEIVQLTGAAQVASSKPYIPKSHVTEDNYVYADLDVTLRMVHYLKKIAPNVDIIMPSDLSDSTLWKSETRRVLPYNSSEHEFVLTGMKNFDETSNAIMNWLGNTNDPQTFKGRILVNTELYKLGRYQVFDVSAETCKGQEDIAKCPLKNEELTAEELVEQYAKILRFISMSENGKLKKDSRIMALVGNRSRWDRDKLKDFVLDDNGDPLTLFESLFEGLRGDVTLINEAKDFNLTNRSIGEFLFAPEPEFRKIVSQGFQPSVDTYFGRSQALLDAIHSKEKQDAKNNSVLDYSYELRPEGVAKIEVVRQDGIPVYLTRQKIDDFKTSRILFDRETGDAFKKTTSNGEAAR